MWEGYMRDVLGWKDQSPNAIIPNKSRNENISDKILNIGDEQFRMRICRADFHGALVKITKSRVPSQIGVQVFSTKIHTIILEQKGYKIKHRCAIVPIIIILKTMLYYRDTL